MSERKPLPLCAGIYAIVNRNTGKRHIGSSECLRKRLWKHFSELKAGSHHCQHLQRSWNKHGREAFRIVILETCLPEPVILCAREQVWIDRYKGRVYNTRPFADPSSLEFWKSEEGIKVAAGISKKVSEILRNRELREFTCKYCGEKAETRAQAPPMFCSRSCRDKHDYFFRNRETRTCERCGKTFEAHRHTRRRFCSRSCSSRQNLTLPVRIKHADAVLECPWCRGDFAVPWDRRKTRKFCSKSCASLYAHAFGEDRYGEKHAEACRTGRARARESRRQQRPADDGWGMLFR